MSYRDPNRDAVVDFSNLTTPIQTSISSIFQKLELEEKQRQDFEVNFLNKSKELIDQSYKVSEEVGQLELQRVREMASIYANRNTSQADRELAIMALDQDKEFSTGVQELVNSYMSATEVSGDIPLSERTAIREMAEGNYDNITFSAPDKNHVMGAYVWTDPEDPNNTVLIDHKNIGIYKNKFRDVSQELDDISKTNTNVAGGIEQRARYDTQNRKIEYDLNGAISGYFDKVSNYDRGLIFANRVDASLKGDDIKYDPTNANHVKLVKDWYENDLKSQIHYDIPALQGAGGGGGGKKEFRLPDDAISELTEQSSIINNDPGLKTYNKYDLYKGTVESSTGIKDAYRSSRLSSLVGLNLGLGVAEDVYMDSTGKIKYLYKGPYSSESGKSSQGGTSESSSFSGRQYLEGEIPISAIRNIVLSNQYIYNKVDNVAKADTVGNNSVSAGAGTAKKGGQAAVFSISDSNNVDNQANTEKVDTTPNTTPPSTNTQNINPPNANTALDKQRALMEKMEVNFGGKQGDNTVGLPGYKDSSQFDDYLNSNEQLKMGADGKGKPATYQNGEPKHGLKKDIGAKLFNGMSESQQAITRTLHFNRNWDPRVMLLIVAGNIDRKDRRAYFNGSKDYMQIWEANKNAVLSNIEGKEQELFEEYADIMLNSDPNDIGLQKQYTLRIQELANAYGLEIPKEIEDRFTK